MRQLHFPEDEIVGTLRWPGSGADDGGPVLATGVVEVPENADVSLSVGRVESVERHGPAKGPDWIRTYATWRGEPVVELRGTRSWTLHMNNDSPLDLSFLRALPNDSFGSLDVVSARVVPESLNALTHLAAGLRDLSLGFDDFEDGVLQHVAQLVNMVRLQTWGNRFTDEGVQQLASLQALETLRLEDENLSMAAFDFVTKLPLLTHLGGPPQYRLALRERFPGLVL